MPNRMLRDWTMSDKVNSLSVHAERFFTRLIMKADDYGCFYADTRVVKANLFPLLLDTIREADLLRWMAECQKAGLIVLYENAGKKYLQIHDFRQRLDKARSKFPFPETSEVHRIVNEFPAELEVRKEVELEKKDPPIGDAGAGAPTDKLLVEYEKIEKNKKEICQFIKSSSPSFIQPYQDLWNIFAQEKGLSKVSKIGNARLRKFKIRVKEKGFDFLEILRKAALSEFVLTGKWFCFDWIIENETNYLKVIEGNYDKKTECEITKIKKQISPPKPAGLSKVQTEINFIFGRFLEGAITVISVEEYQYNFLEKAGLINFSQETVEKIKSLAESHLKAKNLTADEAARVKYMKRFGLLEFFEQQKLANKEIIFNEQNIPG